MIKWAEFRTSVAEACELVYSLNRILNLPGNGNFQEVGLDHTTRQDCILDVLKDNQDSVGIHIGRVLLVIDDHIQVKVDPPSRSVVLFKLATEVGLWNKKSSLGQDLVDEIH